MMHLLFLFPVILVGALAKAGEPANLDSLESNVTIAREQLVWKQGKMGAGGFVTGMDLHPSGDLMLVRTDVGGAYRWDDEADEWIQIATTERLPEGALGFFEYGGVASLVSAPSDIDRLYMAFCNTLYASDDRGETWRAPESVGGSQIEMDPNARVGRLQGERFAVDPANKDVAYYGSNKDGLWYTTDGGRHWQQISTDQVPVGTGAFSGQNRRREFFPGIGNVLIDPSSGNTDGRTNRILATVWGEGLFESKDAGATWARVGEELDLTSIETASIANDGTVVFAQQDGQNAFKYADANLSELNVPRRQRWAEAVINPKNSSEIFLFGPGVIGTTRQYRSTDGGATWTPIAHSTLIADDIPWLAKEAYFSTGAVRFDPRKDRLWIAQGVGVWYSDDALTSDRITWHSQSRGIEELVVNDIVVPEPGQPVIANWDRALIKVEDLEKYPETWGPVPDFSSGWDLSMMASDPRRMVGIFQGQANNPHSGVMLSGYSDDGGRTWEQFAFEEFPFDVKDPYAWVYGNIAVSSQDPNKIIWATVGNDGRFLYTEDRGKTWHDAEFEGGVAQGSWNRAAHFYKKMIAADPLDGDTFYAYNWQNKTLYRSQDGGKTFQIRGRVPSQQGDFHCKLRAVPGRSGHLFFSPGLNNHNFNSNDMGPLLESRDGGETWAAVPGTLKIIDIAFGAPAPGSEELTWYVNGAMDGPDGEVWGFFRSLDEGKSWEKISGIYPMGISKGMSNLAADPGEYGRIYLGTSGIGFFYSELPD